MLKTDGVIGHNSITLDGLADGAIAGMEGGMPEQLEQLDELLITLGASVGRS